MQLFLFSNELAWQGVAWVFWWVLGCGFGSSSKVLGILGVISGCLGS
jgi:hypothetical protein